LKAVGHLAGADLLVARTKRFCLIFSRLELGSKQSHVPLAAAYGMAESEGFKADMGKIQHTFNGINSNHG
jgi:hypothetical protein